MALHTDAWPLRSADREVVALFAWFAGNDAADPSAVFGRGVSVTRTGVGTFTVDIPADLSLVNLYGLQLHIAQAEPGRLTPHFEFDMSGSAPVLTVRALSDAGGYLEHAKTAADGNAGDATAELAVGTTTVAAGVKSVRYVPAAALVADDTNFATLILAKYDADGANKVTVASVTTETESSGGSDSWAAWAPVDLPVAAGHLDAGDSLTLEITKSGTGVAVPAGKLVVTLEGAPVDLTSDERLLLTAWVRVVGD